LEGPGGVWLIEYVFQNYIIDCQSQLYNKKDNKEWLMKIGLVWFGLVVAAAISAAALLD